MINTSLKYYKHNIEQKRYPLDGFTNVAVAFSVRKLFSGYMGKCLKVRRDNDNEELDIGFVNGLLDTASLATFVGENTGYVIAWYDQKGTGVNAVEATSSNCPIITSSGTLQEVNSKPALLFNGTSSKLTRAHGTDINTNNPAFSIIGKATGSAGAYIEAYLNKSINVTNAIGYGFYLRNSTPYSRFWCYGTGLKFATNTFDPRTTNANYHLMGIKNGTNLAYYYNNTEANAISDAETTVATTDDLLIGAFKVSDSPSGFFHGYMQEVILLNTSTAVQKTILYNNSKYFGVA